MDKNLSLSINDLMMLVNLAEINFLICDKIYSGVLQDPIKASPTAAKKEIGHDFLLLAANNAFNESVSILHTLICSTKKAEIRIKPLLEEVLKRDKDVKNKISEDKVDKFVGRVASDYPRLDFLNYDFLTNDDSRQVGDIMGDIRKTKRLSCGMNDLLELKSKFEEFGFHKIRHQTTAHKNKLLQSPAGHANLYLRDDLIKNLGEVIKDLKINSFFWFDYSLGNTFLYLLDSYRELVK